MLEGLKPQGSSQIRINYINILPLKETDVKRLISSILKKPDRKLTQIVYQKCGGNPFNIIQFIKTCQIEGLIYIDHTTGKWKTDIKRIRSKELNNNAAELIIKRIGLLSPPAQYLLSYAACLGNNFDAHFISFIIRKDNIQIIELLKELITNGLIITKNNKYFFPHNKIEQGAYLTIPDSRRRKIHSEIGTYLLDNAGANHELPLQIFNIVGHLNSGFIDVSDHKKIIRLNITAGNTALKSAAYEEGFRYFEAGMKFFTEDMWDKDYEMAFELFKGSAECLFKAGNIEKAVSYTNILLENVHTDTEKGEILYLHILQLDNLGRFVEAVEKIKEASSLLLGLLLPENEEDAKVELEKELKRVEDIISGREIEDIINLPLMTDPKLKIALKILTFLNPPNILGKTYLMYLISLKSVTNSLLFGNTEASVVGYIGYATNLTHRGEYYKGYRVGMLAINLNKKLGDNEYKTIITHSFGQLINHWKCHIKSSITILEETAVSSLKSGDLNFGAYAASIQFLLKIFSGEKLDSLIENTVKYTVFINKINSPGRGFFPFMIQFCLNLKAKTESRLSLTTNEFDEGDFINTISELPIYQSYYKIFKLIILFTYGSYRDGFKCAQEVMENISILSSRYIMTEVYFYYSICITQLFPEFSKEEKIHYKKEFEHSISKMKHWAQLCPENFLHKYLLMYAELARIEGIDLRAMELYDRAIDLAKENEFLSNEALANELAGAYYLNKNRHKIAKVYMVEARYLYKQWGAAEKVKDLEERYHVLLPLDNEGREIYNYH